MTFPISRKLLADDKNLTYGASPASLKHPCNFFSELILLAATSTSRTSSSSDVGVKFGR